MDVAICVKNVSKTFVSQTQRQKIRALNQIGIDIHSGEIMGILGPNGAGKTTFLNILSTLLLPDQGEIRVLGIPLTPKNFGYLRTQLNMSSGHPNFPWSLTVYENLRFYGMLYGMRGNALDTKVDQLSEMFELKDYAARRFDELSSGTKQRLSLAKALLNDPKILFLDEPTVGLDPDIAVKTREIILAIHKETKATILVTSHNMHEIEVMCERVAFIKQGEILKLATPQELKRLHSKKDLEEVFIELAQQKMGENPYQQSNSQTKTIQSPLPKQNLFKTIQLWFLRTGAFTYRNFLFSVRNLFSFMELLFWPMMSLLSIGLMGDYLALQEKALAFIITGAIASGVLQVAQLDVAYSLLYEVWSKSVKHTFLTPIGISESLFGSWVIGILRGIIIFCVLGILAVAFFHYKFSSVFALGIFLFGLFCNAFLLGLIVTFLILIYGQKAEITAWMFAYVFMLLCGIYYPIDTLPPFFFYLAQWIPVTYFLEYFRQGFGFEPLLSHGLAKGFGLVVLYLAVGLKMMECAFHQARKRGVIVRLSE